MQDVLVPLGDSIYLIVGPFHGKFPDAFSFLIDADPVTIIDTGFSPDIAAWLRDAYRPARIVNTHSHIDHCRQNVIFGGCEIWVPEMTSDTFGIVDRLAPRFCDEPAVAESWARAIRDDLLYLEADPPFTHAFGDGHVFDCGRVRLRAIHAPGHLDDHFVFFEENSGLALTVDIDLTKFGPWYGNPESDIRRFRASVETVRTLRPRVVASAHRMPIRDHVDDELAVYARRFDENGERIFGLLREPATMEQLIETKPFYRAHPYRQTLLRFFEKQMIGKHLRILAQEGRVIEREGVFARA